MSSLRLVKELAGLSPWGWDARVSIHPPGPASKRDFSEVDKLALHHQIDANGDALSSPREKRGEKGASSLETTRASLPAKLDDMFAAGGPSGKKPSRKRSSREAGIQLRGAEAKEAKREKLIVKIPGGKKQAPSEKKKRAKDASLKEKENEPPKTPAKRSRTPVKKSEKATPASSKKDGKRERKSTPHKTPSGKTPSKASAKALTKTPNSKTPSKGAKSAKTPKKAASKAGGKSGGVISPSSKLSAAGKGKDKAKKAVVDASAGACKAKRVSVEASPPAPTVSTEETGFIFDFVSKKHDAVRLFRDRELAREIERVTREIEEREGPEAPFRVNTLKVEKVFTSHEKVPYEQIMEERAARESEALVALDEEQKQQEGGKGILSSVDLSHLLTTVRPLALWRKRTLAVKAKVSKPKSGGISAISKACTMLKAFDRAQGWVWGKK